MKPLLEEALKYLNQKYNIKMAFLYGSYSTNTETDESDIDLLVFADIGEFTHESATIQSHVMDALIYPEKAISKPKEYVHILPCAILQDKTGKGNTFIEAIAKARNTKVLQMTVTEKEQLDEWIKKMFIRAKQDTSEANYRYIWLLHDVPELYCQYSGIYYDGPIKTIRYMKKNEKELYERYQKIIGKEKNLELLREIYQGIKKKRI